MTGDLVYRLDSADRLVQANEAWDRFAVENGAPHLVFERVRGRLLWDFVGDATTRHLYRGLIKSARLGRESRFPLRCDSPGVRRRLEMSIRPAGAGGEVEFRARVAHEESRPAPLGGLMKACSWCGKVECGEEWLELEEAARRLSLFEAARLPLVSHGICASCEARMSGSLA